MMYDSIDKELNRVYEKAKESLEHLEELEGGKTHLLMGRAALRRVVEMLEDLIYEISRKNNDG